MNNNCNNSLYRELARGEERFSQDRVRREMSRADELTLRREENRYEDHCCAEDVCHTHLCTKLVLLACCFGLFTSNI